MNNCKYKNRVALIQSETIFEDDTRMEFLKIKRSQLKTSDDAEEIFDFIKNHVSKNNIFRFVLHIDSKVLVDLINQMDLKKQNSSKTRKWLKKCTFIATYSNADYVREKVKSMNANIYFALSPLSTILRSVPNGSTTTSSSQQKEILLVVSDNDSNNKYFEQIYNFFNSTNTTLDKLKLKGLTLAKVNDFSQGGGYMIVFALDTEEEYNTFGALIKSSNYTKQMHCIECTQPASIGIKDILDKVSDLQTSSSGVSINGTSYEGLNTLIAYEKCAAALTLTWKCWSKFKEGSIVSIPK
jgi:hypothetical protein